MGHLVAVTCSLPPPPAPPPPANSRAFLPPGPLPSESQLCRSISSCSDLALRPSSEACPVLGQPDRASSCTLVDTPHVNVRVRSPQSERTCLWGWTKDARFLSWLDALGCKETFFFLF